MSLDRARAIARAAVAADRKGDRSAAKDCFVEAASQLLAVVKAEPKMAATHIHAADISARGILQNLVVASVKKPRGSYGVIAGSRRFRALKLLAERGGTLVHAYGDPWIIEGQGSAGIEAAMQMRARGIDGPDRIVACCGGGPKKSWSMERTKPPGSSTSYSVRSTMTRPWGVTGRCATARSCSTSSVVSVGWRAACVREMRVWADAPRARARTRRIIVLTGCGASQLFR